MKSRNGRPALLLVFLAGCTSGSVDSNSDARGAPSSAAVEASLAKLPPDDRPLAREQRWCVVHTEKRLGSMGAPIKLMVLDQPVFLCCKSCRKKALADPEKTLAKVRELKEKAKKSEPAQ